MVYHDRGLLRESARSNIFFVTNEDVLVTPSEKILWGITRSKIINLAKDFLQVEEREAHLEELLHAKEAFFTSTTKGALPIVEVDGKTIGEGKPGPISKELHRRFQKLTRQYVDGVLTS